MHNFRSPYFSTSIKEFWSRWHISLSTWFRDYVYIPLGGNRVSPHRHEGNLLATFLVSGLWHGANWTYVIWGGLHGLAQIAETALPNPKSKSKVVLVCRWVVTVAFVALAWTFFRAQTISDALFMLRHLFDGINNPITYLKAGYISLNISALVLLRLFLLILSLFVYDFISLKTDIPSALRTWKKPVRWVVYVGMISLMVWLFPQTEEALEFICFQF